MIDIITTHKIQNIEHMDEAEYLHIISFDKDNVFPEKYAITKAILSEDMDVILSNQVKNKEQDIIPPVTGITMSLANDYIILTYYYNSQVVYMSKVNCLQALGVV